MKKVLWLPGYLILGFMYFFPTEWGERRNVAFTHRLWEYRGSIAPILSIGLYVVVVGLTVLNYLPKKEATQLVSNSSPSTITSAASQETSADATVAVEQSAGASLTPLVSATSQPGVVISPEKSPRNIEPRSTNAVQGVVEIDCSNPSMAYEQIVCDDPMLRHQERRIVASVASATTPAIEADFTSFRKRLSSCEMKYCVESAYDEYEQKHVVAGTPH